MASVVVFTVGPQWTPACSKPGVHLGSGTRTHPQAARFVIIPSCADSAPPPFWPCPPPAVKTAPGLAH